MSFFQKLSPVQTKELDSLIELEASWENLRLPAPKAPQLSATLKELQQKQKAYETFRVKLVAYNKSYRPAHIPELLLNTADRLGTWCRSMIALFLAVHDDAQVQYPAHMLEKAYRWAERIADKIKTPPISRLASTRSIPAAIQELEDLAQWCARLAPAKLAG